MGKIDLRFRQIHLDFHTSEVIEGIGARFDPEEFAATLDRARVNSITCFARCHHGWLYYDSKAFPERVHPHLVNKNLLKEQIEACHARDIRVPIYITVQWDHYTFTRHPEWWVITAEGRHEGIPPYEAGFWRRLCLNSPYVDFLKANVQEVLETLPVDGLFLDIVTPMDCSCRYCRAGMEAQGLEPSDPEARRRYGLQIVNNFKRDLTRFVRQFNQDCSIYYNAGHIGTRHRAVVDAYSHFELETLPSGRWGYLHFPLTARYARNLGIDCLGQTGKFHTAWGDFHSFKTLEALQYEVLRMLAMGTKCEIGDQLHPSGKLSEPVYDLVGKVFANVEKKEPWCVGAKAVVDIGVFTPEEFYGAQIGGLPASLMGAGRMLEQAGHQFDVLDSKSDLDRYKVLVLPDGIPVSDEFAARLAAYVAQGGAIVASYKSGLNAAGDAFALEELGVVLKGDAPYSPDFLLPKGAIGKGLPETEHVMYMQGMEVESAQGSEVLAHVILPYFNRTYRHFCSHRHTPSCGKVGYPGIVRHGRAIYFAHPIFTQYNQNAPHWCKVLFLNALELLLPEPVLRHDGPSTVLATINEQAEEHRWVVHLLHYVPERRSQEIDIIEDVIPLYNLKVSVRVSEQVGSVACVPEQEPLDFRQHGGRVEFVVPRIEGHQMVAISFG